MTSMNRRFGKRCLAGAAYTFLLCLLVCHADAKPVTQQFQDLKITYKATVAGTTADNINLVLQGAGGTALSSSKVAVSNSDFNITGFSDHFELKKKMGTIADGDTITLRIRSVANYKDKISLQTAAFKSGATPVGTAEATGGGLAGDPIYTIYNDLSPSADLTVGNLLFYENHAPVDFDTLDPAVLIDTTGIAETGAVLDGAGTFADYSVPSIADGTFFLTQGQIFADGNTSPIGWFVDGYTTTEIPEPSSAVLLLAGLLLAGRMAQGRGKAVSAPPSNTRSRATIPGR